jgi:hypothetical protein
MLPACLFVTGACGWLFAGWKLDGVLPLLIFFKSITLFLFFFFTAALRPREFYYYHNLGISKIRLWLTTAAVDLVVFSTVMVLIYSLSMP